MRSISRKAGHPWLDSCAARRISRRISGPWIRGGRPRRPRSSRRKNLCWRQTLRLCRLQQVYLAATEYLSGAVTHSSRIVGASAPQRCKQLPVQKSSFFVCGIGFFGDSRQSARSGRFHASPRATATRPTLLQPPCCSHPTVTLLQRCTRGAHGRMHTDCGRAAAGGLASLPRVSVWPLRSGPQHWAPGGRLGLGPRPAFNQPRC